MSATHPNGSRPQAIAPQRRLLISAFGIHVGGGLVLFRSLLQASRLITRRIAVDARMPADAVARAVEGGVQVDCVPRSFLSRLQAMRRIGREARSGDTVLCFNSLPPLARSLGKVIVYVHAPHFFGAHAGIHYRPIVAIRLFIERLWFWYGSRYVDEFWVQTPTMAGLLVEKLPKAIVKVFPLIDEQLAALLHRPAEDSTPADTAIDYAKYEFFYPADAVGHKNHAELLKAWHLLDRSGRRPQLTLTLTQDEMVAVRRLAGLPVGELAHVVNVGRQSRSAVLGRLQTSSALIFPSLAETFGLPMLEATGLGVPIIASERDFVRDVCTPRESFDPNSARSIANAVVRFVEGQREKPVRTYSPDEFVKLLSAPGHENPGR